MSKPVEPSQETTEMKPRGRSLDDARVSVRVKLAAAWASFVLLYIYVDYFVLYKPGYLENVVSGKIFTFDISQGFLLFALVSVSIPALMIVLSVALPVTASRWANLVAAALYVPYSIVNIIGEEWVYFFAYGIVVEVALLLFVLWSAWTWPRRDGRIHPSS